MASSGSFAIYYPPLVSNIILFKLEMNNIHLGHGDPKELVKLVRETSRKTEWK